MTSARAGGKGAERKLHSGVFVFVFNEEQCINEITNNFKIQVKIAHSIFLERRDFLHASEKMKSYIGKNSMILLRLVKPSLKECIQF